jgi:hypothetical protein
MGLARILWPARPGMEPEGGKRVEGEASSPFGSAQSYTRDIKLAVPRLVMTLTNKFSRVIYGTIHNGHFI